MDSERIFRDLKIETTARNYSEQTYNSYKASLKIFCDYFDKKDHPININSKEIIEFLAWVNDSRGVCQERSCFWALHFWYVKIEKQKHKFDDIRCPKIQRKIPQVEAHETLMRKLTEIKNPQEKAIVSLFYSTGMRLEELCKIERSNISRERKTILVRLGKGKKDRVVVFSEQLIPLLESHWRKLSKHKKQSRYLFPGEKPQNHISDSTVYRIVKRTMDVNPHLLRHCYATYLHEHGSNLKAMADILGHSRTSTTEIYTHTSTETKRRQPNPFDEKKAA